MELTEPAAAGSKCETRARRATSTIIMHITVTMKYTNTLTVI